jgi:putative oxygen-independent coproporphyrinogen III oxidase
LQTVYIGGGTPSLCPPDLIAPVLAALRTRFGIASDAEITMEMDPGTFDGSKLARYLDLGVNRVSIGVQSFDETMLKACGRAHSLSDAYSALQLLTDSGVPTFSLDLIGGLPQQSMASWQRSLAEAIACGAPHVSVYDLQVEQGTAFGRWYRPGQSPLPTDEQSADMYREASRTLRSAGFDHYEVSNYARPGHQSRHNRAYWENRPFLGFGCGAASYLDGHRYKRPGKIQQYVEWVDQHLLLQGWEMGTDSAGVTRAERDREAAFDEIMVGLRLREGIDLNAMGEARGAAWVEDVLKGTKAAVDAGWVALEPCEPSLTPTNNNKKKKKMRSRLRLTDPEGFLHSNAVISDIFSKL